MICKECGCDLKTKFMIRVDISGIDGDEKKKHFEATSKHSVVGWLKHIMNEGQMYNFTEIQIIDLRKECYDNKDY